MAVYAALLSLMTTLNNIQTHPRVSTFFDYQQIQSLHQIINSLLDSMESSNSHGGSREEEEALERRIASAAHAAEDVIESYVVHEILAGSNGEEKNFYYVLDLETQIQDMNSVKEMVMEFRGTMKFKDEQSSHSVTAASSKPLTTTKKELMVGFDEKVIQIMDRLTTYQPGLQILPIVGMGGIGKTTLAQSVYHNSLIVDSFDIRAWVTISQEYSVKHVLSELLSCIKDRSININIGAVDCGTGLETEDHQLGLKLYQTLCGRRYLIVLDDMWSMKAWDRIKFYFPNKDERSRVVITTRIWSVATPLSSSSFEMDLLDEDQSWKLFCGNVFLEKNCPSELEEIGKSIVRECKGLPLSIVVIGGLLRNSTSTCEYWNNFARDLNSILISGNDEHCFNILSLSYNHLPGHLKPCFLYMGIFREDWRIYVSKLIKLLVAEGFVKSKEGKTLEEVADDCLSDLVERNLILVDSRRWNGRVRYCKMHDLVREVCLKIGEREKFFHRPDRKRRIVVEGGISASFVHTFLCDDVRVLSFAGFESHEDIFQRVNLRYIEWSLNYGHWFTKLASSICLLWNMQTFNCTGYYPRMEAPLEIWYMRQLRHLQFGEVVLPNPPPSEKVEQQDDEVLLPNLQTLSKVVNFSFTERVCKRIPNIKKLCIKYDDEESKKKWYYDLSHLHKLQSLTCIYLVPESVQSLVFPSSLMKLSLERCHLHWEVINKFGFSLPHLEVLKLNEYAVVGSEWNCVEGAFPRLKYMLICCPDLIKWSAESYDFFPVLKHLHLRFVFGLESIPSGISEIQTLVYLDVYGCSLSAAISSLEILEEQLSLGNDDLKLELDLGHKSDFDGMYSSSDDEEEEFMKKSIMETVEKKNYPRKNFEFGAFSSPALSDNGESS